MTHKPTYDELKKKLAQQNKQIDKLTCQLAKLHYLAVAVQDTNDAITVQDFEGNITVWNRGARKMYGWTESQALKMNISEIVPPEKKEEALQLIKDVAQGKEITSFETKRITADGRVLDVWLTATALKNDKGIPIAVATTERNITVQKQFIREKIDLIKELQKTNARLQRAIEETKTLRGIIPICMICKQVRNDKGFWEQVEVYLHNHTEADFSHGICPDCLKEKFPKAYKRLLISAPEPRKMIGG